MVDLSQIKGQMEVRGSDGKHVGTVDGMDGQRVRLASGGMYHHIDADMVESVEKGVVRLKLTAEKATQAWH
ncbi:MAG: DUF2171 domain-containing protein [Hyphomonadaceae bacterium]|jgi:hypothetical protein|nr:DUF2171 domain-containing protein [Hyphomonadaceae bacterium]